MNKNNRFFSFGRLAFNAFYPPYALNLLVCVLWAGAALLPCARLSAQEAQAKAWCLSLRVQRGADQNNLTFLDLTSIPPAFNGELAPDFSDSAYSHYSYLYLTDDLYGDQTGMLALTIPDSGDTDGDGYEDFYQINQTVAALTGSGVCQLSGYGDVTVTGKWYRDAGSKDGSLILTLNINAFQKQVYAMPFELIEYAGRLSYNPATNQVTGRVRLLQTGVPDNLIEGPAQFEKISTNRFNAMRLKAGDWTNAVEQTLSFMDGSYSRDARWPTNYFGYVDFADGDPNTSDPDYQTWILSIDDMNDDDRDGIPNFSDDPAIVGPQAPKLSLARGATNLVLTISGTTNRVHEIQELTSLSLTNWQSISSFTLTNNPQNISIPLPPAPRFWRAKTQ